MDVTRIVVHIDRLVLTGVHPAERHAFAAGLRNELTQLLAASHTVGPLTSHGNVARVRVNTHVVAADASGAGAAVARGIHDALGVQRGGAAR